MAVILSRGSARRSQGGMAYLLAELFHLWRRRAQQRRTLAELSDHLLKDIGINRADVWAAETQKPFWRA